MISETRVDDSFPNDQFFLDGFRITFRLNLNRNGGGIMLSIRNNIFSKSLFLQMTGLLKIFM